MKTLLALLFSFEIASAETLRWEMEGKPADLGGYRIYCKTDSEKPIATLDVGKAAEWDARNFLKGQPDGKKLFFYVHAYDTNGLEGKASNVVSCIVEHKHIK